MAASQRRLVDDYAVGSVPTVLYVPEFIDEEEEIKLLHHINNVSSARWKTLRNRRLQNWGGIVHEKGLLPQELPPWLKRITGRICEATGLFPSPINHVLINEYLPDQGIMPHQDGPAYHPVVAILSVGSPVVLNFTPHQRLMESTSTREGNSNDRCDFDRSKAADTEDFPEEVKCLEMKSENCFSVILMPRSLLIFKDSAYSDYLHGIDDSTIHRLDKAVNLHAALKDLETPSTPSSEITTETGFNAEQKSLYRNKTRVSLTCRLVLKVHKNLFIKS